MARVRSRRIQVVNEELERLFKVEGRALTTGGRVKYSMVSPGPSSISWLVWKVNTATPVLFILTVSVSYD